MYTTPPLSYTELSTYIIRENHRVYFQYTIFLFPDELYLSQRFSHKSIYIYINVRIYRVGCALLDCGAAVAMVMVKLPFHRFVQAYVCYNNEAEGRKLVCTRVASFWIWERRESINFMYSRRLWNIYASFR